MENLVTLIGMVGVVSGGLWLQRRSGRTSGASAKARCDICAVPVPSALLTPFETPSGEEVALCRLCHPAHAPVALEVQTPAVR